MICLIRSLALPRPFVFGDELLYALQSKFAGREALLKGNMVAVGLPNVLYFHLYKLVFHFGENFLEAAKALNVVFLALALAAIYGAVNRFRSSVAALAAVAIIGLGPASSYSFYFMPECMYFCVFSVAVYCFVRYSYSQPLLSATLCGICLGTGSLVKPHGLILLAPWLMTIVLLKLSFYPQLTWQRVGAMMLCLSGAMAASLGLVNLALTGHLAFGLGNAYGPLAVKSASSGTPGLIAGLMGAHIAAISSLYALPLLVAGVFLLQRRVQHNEEDLERGVGIGAMVLLTMTCLITLIFTTSKFTTLWTAGSPELLRLFGRYYFFVLSWLVASFFCAYPELDWSQQRVKYGFLSGGVVLGAIALLASVKWGGSHILYLPDFPELFWFYTQHNVWRFVVAAVTIATLIVYLVRRPSSTLFAASFGLLAALGSAAISLNALAQPPTPAEAASAVFKPIIRPDAFDKGVVVLQSGSDVEAYRLMFYLLGAYDVVVEEGTTPVTESEVSAQRPWAIVAGTREVGFPYLNSVSIGRYTLYLRSEGVSALYVAGVPNPSARQRVKISSGKLFSRIDVLGEEAQTVTESTPVVAAGSPLHVSGWAVEPDATQLAGGVTVVLDGKSFQATYNLGRGDVADYFHNPGLRSCGFSVVIPGEAVGKGAHEAVVQVVSKDGQTHWPGKQIKFQAEKR